MPAFALILAGYAAYAKYEQSKLAKYDDTIHLEGKSSIALLPSEQEMSILQYPICTIAFFEGDSAHVAPHLERRVSEILAANPWLSGWLIRDATDDYRVKIYYDATLQDRCKGGGGHLEVVTEPFVPLPVTQNKNEVRAFEALLVERNLIVPNNYELIGRDRPFWKVAVVPCLDDPRGKFALVVSMSHAAGDAHTYYQLFQMLDLESSVVALDANRVPYREALEAMSDGKQSDAEYLAEATKHPLIDLSAATTGGSGADDPIVMKTFFVDADWILDRKSERQSVFVTPDKIAEQIQGGEERPSRDAGFSSRSGKIATVVSLNSILTSWWFQLNGASIGLMAVNVRHRLDACEVGDHHAGNYVTTIPYTPDDYRTPGRIQQSLRRLQRCGPDATKDLPPLSWKMTCSLSNDWSRWFRDELYLHDTVSLKLHMPLWHTEFVASLPSRFSSLHMFTAQPEGIDGRERRLGATVVCRRSVWDKVQASGVVDEMIVDF
jgi:hypothetical protein